MRKLGRMASNTRIPWTTNGTRMSPEHGHEAAQGRAEQIAEAGKLHHPGDHSPALAGPARVRDHRETGHLPHLVGHAIEQPEGQERAEAGCKRREEGAQRDQQTSTEQDRPPSNAFEGVADGNRARPTADAAA